MQSDNKTNDSYEQVSESETYSTEQTVWSKWFPNIWLFWAIPFERIKNTVQQINSIDFLINDSLWSRFLNESEWNQMIESKP